MDDRLTIGIGRRRDGHGWTWRVLQTDGHGLLDVIREGTALTRRGAKRAAERAARDYHRPLDPPPPPAA